MTEHCPRCGGEMTEMPSTHPPKKIKVCNKCQSELMKKILSDKYAVGGKARERKRNKGRHGA